MGLAKLMAPIVPFLSEEMYRNLTNEESVHLADYPEVVEKYIDKELEDKMDLVRLLISVGRMVREEAKIKVRQPLKEALIDGSNEAILKDLVPLIKEELNVKEVVFVNNLEEYMDFTIKPNFKVVGKTMGAKIKEFGEKLNDLKKEDITKLNNNEVIIMDIAGEKVEVNREMVDIRISSKEGFNVGMEDNNFIILNTELSHELVLEGIAREIVSKVQNMRKTEDYNVSDRIIIDYNGDEDIKEALKVFKDYVAKETLAVEINYNEELKALVDINGHAVNISVKRS